MFFTKEQDDTYHLASEELILREANKICYQQLQPGKYISNSRDAESAITCKLSKKQNEVFVCLFMDNQHRILAFKEMSQGTINQNTVYPREVVKEALQLNAAAVIFAHNHPSGVSKPSDNDIELTITLRNILKVINVKVLDHLVIGESVVSFADSGLMADPAK